MRHFLIKICSVVHVASRVRKYYKPQDTDITIHVFAIYMRFRHYNGYYYNFDNTTCTQCVNSPVSFGKGADLECFKMQLIRHFFTIMI